MNAQPHTHEPEVRKPSEDVWFWLFFFDSWKLRYGDTTVSICRGSHRPSSRLVERATKRAIRKHDRGSLKAGKVATLEATAQRYAGEVAKSTGWNP